MHPEAAREVEETVRWYESRAAGLGQEFLDELERGFAAIQNNPETWPEFHAGIRRYLLHRFPYGILYMAKKDALYVLAIMHTHRKPGYWKDRGGK